ncbi:MAG: O-antigen ligase family protein [Limisphaerales bacterium]
MPGESGVRTAARGEEAGERGAAGRGRAAPRLGVRDVQLYWVCESLTELLIYLMVIFSPWAFGTTQDWSIRIMNAGGYALGGLLAVKLGIRWLKGYRPPRWRANAWSSAHSDSGPSHLAWLNPIAVLSVLTVAIVAYCWVSAWNARADCDPQSLLPVYRDSYIGWLPHSMDGNQSWRAFWNYLALACSFLAVLDWLPGKTGGEERGEGGPRRRGRRSRSGHPFPVRLRRLLWVLTINGGLLGLEGIIQRAEGSGFLLFMVRPHIHVRALDQFGPYAYRSNAAQYFNLLWPISLGFWWALLRGSGFGQAGPVCALVSTVVMAACPIISTTRLGAAAAIGMLAAAPLCLLAIEGLDRRRRRDPGQGRRATLLLVLFSLAALGLGLGLGWKALGPRLGRIEMREGFEGRQETYDRAKPMAEDYPVFGTGPGTFGTVFQFYRKPTEAQWWVQLHDDWLETRITFGWVGCGLIGLAFVTVILRWFGRGGIHGSRRFMVLMWLSLAGCLTQARWDFPFQIYSIVFLALVLCAIAANLTRRGA